MGTNLAFFDAVNTFRPLELAEVECPKGRTFTWRITDIEAGGYSIPPAARLSWGVDEIRTHCQRIL